MIPFSVPPCGISPLIRPARPGSAEMDAKNLIIHAEITHLDHFKYKFEIYIISATQKCSLGFNI